MYINRKKGKCKNIDIKAKRLKHLHWRVWNTYLFVTITRKCGIILIQRKTTLITYCIIVYTENSYKQTINVYDDKSLINDKCI